MGATRGWQCCVESEKRVKRNREDSQDAKKSRKGNLPFYFTKASGKSTLTLGSQTGFVGFWEEGFGSEVAAKC